MLKPTNIESAMIAHGINNDTAQEQIAKKVLLTLEKANKDLAQFIKQSDGVYTKKRYGEIKKRIEKIAKELSENIEKDIDVDSFLEKELSELRKVYTDIGGLSSFEYPSAEQIKTAATFTPYTEYGSFDTFLENVGSQFFNIWDSAVRTGYMTGMTTQEIVGNVMGSAAQAAKVANPGTIQRLRNSVMANTRTALQSFAIETNNEIFRQNEDVINGYEWLATLDRRSCLVCGSYDGKKFKSLDAIKTMPPIHLRCRCMIIPAIEVKDDTRASESGQVDSKIKYEDWLKAQSEDVQIKVLGKKKYELFKSGEGVGDFVGNGKVLNLNTLKESIPEKHSKSIKQCEKNLEKLASTSYSGIWKNAVNPSEYSFYKDRIPAKKEYFEQKLADSAISENDKAKFTKALNDLADFEKKGKSYNFYVAKKEKNIKQLAEVKKIFAPTEKVGKNVENAFSQERKDNALWAKSAKEADEKLREISGSVWKEVSESDRTAAYDYTSGSGGFNRPLSGYEKPWADCGSGWEEKYYKGVDKVWIDYEGKGENIRRLTNMIDKSSYDFDMWLQRGSNAAGIEVNIGLKRGTLKSMTDAELQSLVGKDFVNYSFTSCGSSKGQGFANSDVIWNVYAPKGTKMLYAEPFSCYGQGGGQSWNGIDKQKYFGRELETIIQRGATFRITKIGKTGGTIYIDMEVRTEKGYKTIQQNPNDWKGKKEYYK